MIDQKHEYQDAEQSQYSRHADKRAGYCVDAGLEHDCKQKGIYEPATEPRIALSRSRAVAIIRGVS